MEGIFPSGNMKHKTVQVLVSKMWTLNFKQETNQIYPIILTSWYNVNTSLEL